MNEMIPPESLSTGEKSSQSWKDLIELLPGVLAFVYLEGYLTASSHFAVLQFTKSDLVSGRYLSAGVLFVLMSGIPLTALLSAVLAAIDSKPERRNRAVLRGLLTFLAGAVLYGLLLLSISLSDSFIVPAHWKCFFAFLLPTGLLLTGLVLRFRGFSPFGLPLPQPVE